MFSHWLITFSGWAENKARGIYQSLSCTAPLLTLCYGHKGFGGGGKGAQFLHWNNFLPAQSSTGN